MNIATILGVPEQGEFVSRVIAQEPRYKLAWQAASAEAGIRLCEQCRPDLLLLDLMSPDMGGVAATRHIMAHSPCPILIVAANARSQSPQVFEAMGFGALDVLNISPVAEGSVSHRSAVLLAKLDLLERRLLGPSESMRAWSENPPRSPAARVLVVIGASAGGPAALRTVVDALPAALPAPVVIVQHLDQRFAQGLVDWLGVSATLPVRICEEGDAPAIGTVMVAGRNGHLVFKGPQRLGYSANSADHLYCPSVDALFSSVARWWKGAVVGVILTGMGNDGAVGLKVLHALGHHTIVQDRDSSSVFGMPKAAIECGAAAEVLPLDRIACGLVKAVSTQT